MQAVTVFSGLAVQQPLECVIFPDFRQRYDVNVDATFAPTTILARLLREGSSADVIVGVEPDVIGLASEGLVESDSIEALLTTGLGAAVAPGVPLPKCETLQEFVALLVQARSVAYSQAGASGIYFSTLLDRLGMPEVKSRATVIPSGYTAECLLDGRADLAIQQISELRSVPDVQLVGPFPPAVQQYTVFAAANVAGGRRGESVDRFRELLRSQHAREAYMAAGLAPLDRGQQRPRGLG